MEGSLVRESLVKQIAALSKINAMKSVEFV